MRYLSALATLLALGVPLAACQNAEPDPGTAGGRCRVNLFPCDTGLICRDQACRAPSASDRPTLDAVFTLIRLAPEGELAPGEEGEGTKPPYVAGALSSETVMRADGRDRAAIRVQVMRRDTREPWTGTARLWLDPPEAGRLGDTTIELDEEGTATTSLTVCDKVDLECPWRATIKVTASDEVLTPIGSSPYIWLEGGHRPPEPDTGTGGAGGGDGGSAGGGVVDEIPEGIVPWGHSSSVCPTENTWSFADKPDGFIMTSWDGSARGGVRINFTYVLASDPTRTLEGVYTFRGSDERGTYELTPGGASFDITYDNQDISCGEGFVLLHRLEKKAGDSLRLVSLEYRVKCGPENTPLNGCYFLLDELLEEPAP